MAATTAPRFTLRSALDDAKPKLNAQQATFTVPSLSFAAPTKGNISQGFDYPKSAPPPMQSPPPMYSQPSVKPFPSHIQVAEPLQQPSYVANQYASAPPPMHQPYSQLPHQQQMFPQTQPSATNGGWPQQSAMGAHGIAPASAAMAQQDAIDRSTEPDTIRAKFHEFVVAPIDTDVTPTLPHCLAVRGMEKSAYSSVILRVRQVKKTNQINKGMLWFSMIFLLNLTGYLLVEKRLIGNTRLSAKLLPILHEANTHLVTSGINARFVWTNGELRVHYK